MTVVDMARPGDERWAALYDIGVVVAGSLFIAAGAQIAVGYPVPITGQTLAVLLAGALLGSRRGALCVLTYLAEGAAGLPVFSHGRGGIAVFFGPTGGYLVGFVAAAYLVGHLAERRWDRRFWSTVLAMSLGNIVIYAFGLAWLSVLFYGLGRANGGQSVLAVGLYPFVVGDLIKIVLAAMLLPSGWRLLRYLGLA